jgi:hypothetical protein
MARSFITKGGRSRHALLDQLAMVMSWYKDAWGEQEENKKAAASKIRKRVK